MSPLSHSALLQLAVDMANSVTASDRFERLLNTVRSHIQCDAVVLLRLQGGVLKPLAQKGLHREILGRRFVLAEHPRLDTIYSSTVPVRFSADCDLPDPYDGMLPEHEGDLPIHACMGLPLLADDRIIGVLTMDSMLPGLLTISPAARLN
ncbi:GAF domain-containing protein [Aliamphritea spongicola]|nr:GAF domain-containing protein [Aliamphritea spongicola]